VRRLSRVVGVLIETMRRGERLSDATLADYAAQLRNVDADSERVERMLQALWQFRAADDGVQ
jgi:hypothetical protein